MKVNITALWLLTWCVSSVPLPSRCDSVTDNPNAPPLGIPYELEKAAAVGMADPDAIESALAPFRALRSRYPDNIFIQEAYQDAIQRYGVEGRLKALTVEYRLLDVQHDGSRMYHYLYLRSLVGYSTKTAMEGLAAMTTQDPNFAPAHGTLAEIYGSVPFRDAAKENIERQAFLHLCPGATLPVLPPPLLLSQSPLIDQAEKLLALGSAPDRIIAMTVKGIDDDEWRWQHIHPHDWYNDDYKRKTLLDLRASYWKAWSIQVRCYRRMGQPDKAADLLARMDNGAIAFLKEPGHQYWDALATLVQLYAEGKQRNQAAQKLEVMTGLLAKNPDPNGAAQIQSLKALVARSASSP